MREVGAQGRASMRLLCPGPPGVGVLSPAVREMRPTHPLQAVVRAGSPTLPCTEPQFPRTHGAPASAHRQLFSCPKKSRTTWEPGAAAGGDPERLALYAWHCLRERPRRRGPREDGDGAGGAGRAGLRRRPGRASSSRLAAGARGLRPGCGPGVAAWGGRSGGRPRAPGRAWGGGGRAGGGGTCCSGPCAPGRPPLSSSWRSRRRRAAPRRSRARPLRTDGAVSGPPPRPRPRRRPPARGPAHKGARALPRSLRSRYSAASSRISREFSSILLPARALWDGGGRCPALSGRLRSPPAPRARRPHFPDSRGLPARSAATLRLGPSN